MHLTSQAIKGMISRHRAHFINSLSGFKSANLIGSQDAEGNTNLAIVSSVFHLGADPALVGMIMRPHTVRRDTLDNIEQTEHYTINHVNGDIWKQAHQTSAKYAQYESEFDKVGLTPSWLSHIPAPFVEQSHIKMAVKLAERHTIALNKTEMVIGEITDVIVPNAAVKDDGFIDIETVDTVCVSGLDRYHSTQALGRLSYAKPDVNPDLIMD